MTIEEFASRYRARVKRDDVGDVIVAAKHGQIYDYGKGQFGVMFLMDGAGAWNNRRKACQAVGMRLIQDGDTEGTCLFDPTNAVQSRLAVKLVGARIKRQVSPEAADRLAGFRFGKKAAESPET